MKKLTIILAVIGLISVLFATTMTVHTTTGEQEFEISEITSITFDNGSGSNILTDDFENYDVNTFPSAGGWEITYNGAGNQYQYITEQYSNSGLKSFRLQGQSSWGAKIDNELSQTPEDEIYFEAHFYSESAENEGSIGIGNPDVGTWGTTRAGLRFYDGLITAGVGDSSFDLMDYIPGQWYKVKIKCDFENNELSVWVNDVQYLFNEVVNYNTAIDYTTFFLHAWNNGSNIVFFDDVEVWTE